jgi:hypothetical protein
VYLIAVRVYLIAVRVYLIAVRVYLIAVRVYLIAVRYIYHLIHVFGAFAHFATKVGLIFELCKGLGEFFC